MTDETNTPETVTPEVMPDSSEMVPQPPKSESEIQEELKALIDAIRTKAQSEVQKIGGFTREQFLDAVRNTREQIEKLNFEPERVEEAIAQVQSEAEKNWDNLAKEIKGLGDRLNEAAKAAWEVLRKPRSEDS